MIREAAAAGPSHASSLEAAWLGRVGYRPALALQEELRRRLLALRDRGVPAPASLLLLEHHPVITLGRSANPHHVLVSDAERLERGIELVHTSRGGDVTLHAPGQLVAYPVVHLTRGVEAYVAALAQAAIDVARELGVVGEYRRSAPGVWVGDRKLCAIGVQIHRRVAIHGLALNVNNSLAGFESIVPCGLAGFGVTSIAALTGQEWSLSSLAQRLAVALAHRLGHPLRFLGTHTIDSLLSRSGFVE